MVTDGTNPRKVISCRLSYGLAGDPWLANCRVSRDGDVNSSYSYYSTHAAREGSKWTWRHRTAPWPRPRAGTRASVSTAGRRAGPGASAGSSTAPSSASPSTGPAPTASPSRWGGGTWRNGAWNEGLRRFHNYEEGLCLDLLLVQSQSAY